MEFATNAPHPYLLNQAGGTCPVKEFSIVGEVITLVPADDKPMQGSYHLVYRNPNHQHSDIKLAVVTDGHAWSLNEPLPPGIEAVRYPQPTS